MSLLRSLPAFSLILAILTLLLGIIVLVPPLLAALCAFAHVATPPSGFTRIFGPLWVLLGFTQIGVATTSRKATRARATHGERAP